MTSSLIGITTGRSGKTNGYPVFTLAEAYASALLQADASPVLIPMAITEEALSDIFSRLDGLLFSGGGDMHPHSYGGDEHPRVDLIDPDRDRGEVLLVEHAMERRMPVFGICRGLQVINVALGGTLYEDLDDQFPNALKHDYYDDQPRDYLAHTIRVETDSRLARILGSSSTEVNSLHHQGIRRLAPSLRASAFAPDGLIEATELLEYPFGLAVQWHPECLQAYTPMRHLFQAFVDAANIYRDGKA